MAAVKTYPRLPITFWPTLAIIGNPVLNQVKGDKK